MAGSADDIIAYAKANGGCGCGDRFEPGQIDRPGSSGKHGKHQAVDFGTANCGATGPVCIYNLFLPMAQGDDYKIEELFCNMPGGGSWSHGKPSTYVDNPAHCHVAIRDGAVLGGGATAARTSATNVSLNPLDILDGGLKAAVGIILDALAKVPAAILGAFFGDHSPVEFGVRVLEVLAGALLMGTGVVMVVKVVTKDVPQSALRKATRGPRKQVQRAQREVGRRARAGEVEAEGAKTRVRRGGEATAGAGQRATETVTGSKAGGAKLRKMVARAI